jgi:hypothetical protein
MLLAALLELALVVARASDRAAAVRAGEAAVDDLLHALVAAPTGRAPARARPARRAARPRR